MRGPGALFYAAFLYRQRYLKDYDPSHFFGRTPLSSKQFKQVKQAQPVATTKDEQAPILPFAPYEADPYPEYTPPYSGTLVEKSNALALKIWPTKEAYLAHQGTSLEDNSKEITAAKEFNNKFFSKFDISSLVEKAFSVDNEYARRSSFSVAGMVREFIKKLKRLEKQYDDVDLIGYDKRDAIIDLILLPVQMYGTDSHYEFSRSIDLRYPTVKGVMNELVTPEDVSVMESIINFIPRMRVTLASQGPEDSVSSVEQLLKPIVVPKVSEFSTFGNNPQAVLQSIKRVHRFLNEALPHNVVSDHIPEFVYPLKSTVRFSEVQRKSADLRNTVLGYIQEEKVLSELLQAIVDLSDALNAYFTAMVEEIDSCFKYFNRIGLSYETIVKESEERLRDSSFPF